VDKAMPVRDLRVEEQVRDRYLARAKEVGISDAAAIELSALLVRESVEAQAKLPRPMKPRKVLVVGGGGAMGQWLCRFFASRGHEVKVFDDLPGVALGGNDREAVAEQGGCQCPNDRDEWSGHVHGGGVEKGGCG